MVTFGQLLQNFGLIFNSASGHSDEDWIGTDFQFVFTWFSIVLLGLFLDYNRLQNNCL